MIEPLDEAVSRATQLSYDKTVLESKLRELKKSFDDLVTRYDVLQEAHWKLQDRHLKLQETLMQKLY